MHQETFATGSHRRGGNRLGRILLMLAMTLALLIACDSDSVPPSEQIPPAQADNASAMAPIVPETDDATDITRGNDAFIDGDFNSAIDLYEEGLRQNRSVAFYNLGVSYYQLGNLEESERNFKSAIQEDPNFVEALMNLSTVLVELDKLEEASGILQRLLGLQQTPEVFVNYANVLLRLGDTATAAYYYDQALQLDSESPFVVSNYASFLMSIGEVEAGVRTLENLPNKNYTIYYNIAAGNHALGEYRASIDAINEALAINPTIEALEVLARNYHELGDYAAEARVYTRQERVYARKAEEYMEAARRNPTYKNRYRYIHALYKSRQHERAADELEFMVEDYPQDVPVNVLNYENLVRLSDFTRAGDAVAGAYRRIGSDELLYLLVRHALLFEQAPERVAGMLNGKSPTEPIQLARALTALVNGDLPRAASALDAIRSPRDNDYHVYRAYISLREGDFARAFEDSIQIEVNRPEYFWYNLVVFWNRDDLPRLRDHVSAFKELPFEYIRKPVLTVSLDPVFDDIQFSYEYNGSYEEQMRTVLYPVLMDPDEILEFLALGYRLLNEDARVKALDELQKSIRFSDGIRANNRAVSHFLAGRYEAALREFRVADDHLRSNPVTLFNIGLTLLNLGEIQPAQRSFERAIEQNRFLFPAYLGNAICYAMIGDESTAKLQYNSVLTGVDQFASSAMRSEIPDMVYRTRYLAELGLGMSNRVIFELGEREELDPYLEGILAFARYLEDGSIDHLGDFARSGFYRADTLEALASQHRGLGVRIPDLGDRYARMMENYIAIRQGRDIPEATPAQVGDDRVLLKERVYYNIMQDRPDKALAFLQRLNDVDLRYPELYKASFYYFMWLGDFVNAEASFTSLERLNYRDMYSDYYMMIYFLLNRNERRLLEAVNNYADAYPQDFRGPAMRGVSSILANDLPRLEEVLSQLSIHEIGNFLEHFPLEFNIEGI